MILLLISLAGAGLFLWPLTGLAAPSPVAALAVGLGTAGGLLALEVGTRRLDSRRLALLAALSATDAGLRATLVSGIGGFNPIFLLVLCGGYVLGPSFGFLLGACSLLVSALVTGGLGPWVPYQLFALGWVGAAAGLAGRARAGSGPTRVDALVLAGVGVVTGFAFGVVMDIWNWTYFFSSPSLGWHPGLPPLTALRHFAGYYALTSLGYDSFRAVGNALLVLALGIPLLAGLGRLGRRFEVHWPAPEPTGSRSTKPADHEAAGHLVVPALLTPIHASPSESDEGGADIEEVSRHPGQAPAQT